MKRIRLSPKDLWIEFEDFVAPALGMNVKDRAVYSYLLRHSLVLGKLRVQFAVTSLARILGLSQGLTRRTVRRLEEQGALRVVERSKYGHLAEVALPEMIRAAGSGKTAALVRKRKLHESRLETTDFMETYELRKSIHDREKDCCFYCLRRAPGKMKCLDHVVPRVRHGQNFYRNLVSCCMECNGRKADRPAGDFVRTLYRQGRLTSAELDGRLRALKDLRKGKLQPIPPISAG